jgi:hypothetical protein
MGTIHRVDPSIVTSLTAGIVLLTALATSHPIEKIAQLVVQTTWLYLSNTRG